MKKILSFALLLTVICTFYACDCEKGSGNIITETRNFDYFDKLQLQGDYTVYLYEDTVASLTIEADDNIVPLVDTYLTTDDRLIVETDKCIRKHHEIVLHIAIPKLSELRIDGSADVNAASDFETQQLLLESYGSGHIKLNGIIATIVNIDIKGSGDVRIDELNTQSLDVEITGSGNVDVRGFADLFDIDIYGSGNVYAYYLDAGSCDINISGSGNCEVNVSGNLDVHITGSGNVYYRGNPSSVEIFITGTGAVFDAG